MTLGINNILNQNLSEIEPHCSKYSNPTIFKKQFTTQLADGGDRVER